MMRFLVQNRRVTRPLVLASMIMVAAVLPPESESLLVRTAIPADLSSCRWRSTTTTSTTARFVFERMSEDCIAAVVTGQQQADLLQLPEVTCECVLLGCIDHPEKRALTRTLAQYRVDYRRAQKTLKTMYDSDDAQGWLRGFHARKTDDDRPFARDLKKTFQAAGQLATQRHEAVVSTHHLFLALLNFKDVKGVRSAATIDAETQICTCGAWAVLQKMDCLDDSVTALHVCETLLDHLAQDDDTASLGSGGNDSKELVTGVGGASSSKTPTLADVGTDLTQLAADGLLDPVHGRETEIRACLRTLMRRRKNNVCLIGEAGVGKTAIAEGVAQVLVSPQCPAKLVGHRVMSVELAALVAGTKYRGEFEERLQNIIKEVTDPKAPPTILFLDELHNLVGAGAAEGGMDAANLLKPALARGNMQVMGATTIAEYRKYIEKDAALERRLQPVLVKEPTVEQTRRILDALQPHYEKHHGVRYTPLALDAAVALSDRYLTDRFLPDKALDILDEAGAVAHLDGSSMRTVPDNNDAVDDAVPVVDEHTVAAIISEWSGVPMGKLETGELQRLQALETEMTARVKGQGRAVRGVARAIRRARSGLRDPRRPVASFLFCGPTGTGKTELCKTLAETYYGSEKDMIRIDCSEYMEKHSVSRLIGPPPGYVGYDEGGQLTEAVRKASHSVVLLDEVEKAHGDVLNILLQIMEDGVLTDGKGRTVNFKNVVLVMTSNVGSKRILEVFRGNASSNADTVHRVNGAAATMESEIEPMQPDKALEKLQNSPKAAKLMMQAATDPAIMKAMQAAMGGSPADLLKAGRNDPKVATFLRELWSVVDEDAHVTSTSSNAKAKSGLDAIRGSMADSMDKWSDFSKSEFATGLVESLNGLQSGSAGSDHDLYPELARVVKEELESAMKPELLNRIDEIIVFSPLATADLSSIAELIIQRTVSRAEAEHDMTLVVEAGVVQRVMEEGSALAEQFGARPMRRAAQRFVEDSLSDAIIQGFLKDGDSATIDVSSNLSNGRDIVVLTRTTDGQKLDVLVESSDGGIGSINPRPSRSVNGANADTSANVAT